MFDRPSQVWLQNLLVEGFMVDLMTARCPNHEPSIIMLDFAIWCLCWFVAFGFFQKWCSALWVNLFTVVTPNFFQRISISKSEDMVHHQKGVDYPPTQGLRRGFASNGDVSISWGLVHECGKEGAGDWQGRAISWSVVVKREQKAKFLIYRLIYVPTPICGHHELSLVTKRTRSQIQSAKMFSLWVAGLSLKYRLKSVDHLEGAQSRTTAPVH